jgi:dTMP kinase
MIRNWMKEGYFVIVDRYVYSNIAFQCAKLTSAEERLRLRDWILDFEFHHNKLPKPDLNLLLHVPIAFTRRQLVSARAGDDRAYLKGERDIHEEDLGFQERVMKEYISLQQYVDDLRLISCADDSGGMQAPGTISEIILKQLEIKQ